MKKTKTMKTHSDIEINAKQAIESSKLKKVNLKSSKIVTNTSAHNIHNVIKTYSIESS